MSAFRENRTIQIELLNGNDSELHAIRPLARLAIMYETGVCFDLGVLLQNDFQLVLKVSLYGAKYRPEFSERVIVLTVLRFVYYRI